MSFANHTTIPRTVRWILLAISMGLSSVTVVSVGLSIFGLIEAVLMASLFAAAAILLDVFKYIAWPVAARFFAGRRWVCGGLLAGCALVLSGVSCWATYDRMMSSIIGSRAEHLAIQEQRIVDLEQSRVADSRLIAALDAQAESIRDQAQVMRERGMVSKAADLEGSALPRIADQRENARLRLDQQSRELTGLRAAPPKAANVPLWIAALLCLGFAVAMEAVPALILTVLRCSAMPSRAEQLSVVEPETPEPARETLEETGEMADVQSAASPMDRDDNADLLRKLLEQTAEMPDGSLVTLREFAKTQKIRPLRAGQVFSMAMEVGRLKKVSNRYMVCGGGKKPMARIA